ncbi:helix-turn-helix domain-containing protein [Actinophytocola sediminis]
MATGLLSLLGIDENDPRIAAGRKVAAQLADTVEKLVRARRDRGLTQAAVAEQMETTQSAVSNFERIGGDPKLSTILRYANAIGAQVHIGVSFDGHAPVTTSQSTRVTARSAEAGMPSVAHPSGVYVAADQPIMVAAR